MSDRMPEWIWKTFQKESPPLFNCQKVLYILNRVEWREEWPGWTWRWHFAVQCCAGGGGGQMPLKRELFLVGPSWRRGSFLPDGVIDVASSRLLLPASSPETHSGE